MNHDDGSDDRDQPPPPTQPQAPPSGPPPARLVALEVARAGVRQLVPMIEPVRSRVRDLANQLQRAAQSVLLNIEEGRKRTLGDQRKAFSIACGSASEVRAAVEVAEHWGYVTHVGHLHADMDRLVGLLWGASRPRRR